MQTGNVTQRLSRPNNSRHNSRMWVGWFGIFAVLKPGKPGVRLFARNVQTGGLVIVPGGLSIVKDRLPPFFALKVLVDSVAQQPRGRLAPARRGRRASVVGSSFRPLKGRVGICRLRGVAVFSIMKQTLLTRRRPA